MAVGIEERANGRLYIRFRYEAALVEKIKAIPGRRWHPEEKAWSVPAREGMEELLRAVFPGARFEIDAAITAVAEAWRIAAAKTEEQLLLEGYSPRTRKAYKGHCLRFLRHLGKDPLAATTPDDIRRYLLHLITEAKVSRSYYDQAISAVRFLYEKVLRAPNLVQETARPRKERKLPAVLSREAVRRLLASVGNAKHLAILMLVYSAGLRVSEVVSLRPEDLDEERGLISVRGGKGRKDRCTVLSSVALRTVKTYQSAYPTGPWLFPGAEASSHRGADLILTRTNVRDTIIAATYFVHR